MNTRAAEPPPSPGGRIRGPSAVRRTASAMDSFSIARSTAGWCPTCAGTTRTMRVRRLPPGGDHHGGDPDTRRPAGAPHGLPVPHHRRLRDAAGQAASRPAASPPVLVAVTNGPCSTNTAGAVRSATHHAMAILASAATSRQPAGGVIHYRTGLNYPPFPGTDWPQPRSRQGMMGLVGPQRGDSSGAESRQL